MDDLDPVNQRLGVSIPDQGSNPIIYTKRMKLPHADGCSGSNVS